MHSNFVTTRVRKRTVIFGVCLSVLTLFVLDYSVFRYYSHCDFFERKTGVSLAALKNVKTYDNGSFTGEGWVVVIGQIPHERMDSFINDYQRVWVHAIQHTILRKRVKP